MQGNEKKWDFFIESMLFSLFRNKIIEYQLNS